MDLNSDGTARLRGEQIRAIDGTVEKLEQLQKYVDDYMSLGNRLRTLPDQVKHNVMVPFGKFAFMPGELIHTNEILVLLGDDWFCERSAKQAAEIATRRAQSVKKSMEDLEKQKSLLQPRLDFTTELQDLAEAKSGAYEIREEFDAETEELWKEQHREKVRAHKQSLRLQKEQVHTKPVGSVDSTSSDESDLWRRLDELERQERRNREMSRLDEENCSSVPNILPNQINKSTPKEHDSTKHVKWKDEATGNTESEDSGSSELSDSQSGDSDDNSGDSPIVRPSTIVFTHTRISAEKSPDTDCSSVDQEVAAQVQSPADIYTQFVQPTATTPKSILKPSTENFQQQPEIVQKQNRPHHVESISQSLDGAPEAFTGAVLEKTPEMNIDKISLPCDNSQMDKILSHSEVVLEQTSEDVPKKRVSRFKARQMKGS